MGVKSDGSYAGTLSVSGTILTFDVSGNIYAEAPNSINIYSTTSGPPSLVRFLSVVGYPGCSCTWIRRNVVRRNEQRRLSISKYGERAIAPTVCNPSAGAAVATDSKGNVYAAYGGGSGFGEWSAGQFGTGPPASTYPSVCATLFYASTGTLYEIAVDVAGNVFAVCSGPGPNGHLLAELVVEYPSGTTSGTVVQSYLSNYYSQNAYVATPLK